MRRARTRRRIPRPLLLLIAVVCGAAGLYGILAPGRSPAQAPPQHAFPSTGATRTGEPTPVVGGEVTRGRELFVAHCASCHGYDANGLPDRAPSLHGVGAQAADFYLSTGRMPLAVPGEQPERRPPAFSRHDNAALTAYIASLGGPGIPEVHPSEGILSDGLHLFTVYCAGCHQQLGRAGLVTPSGVAAFLQAATATQIAEAVRTGPYLMPKFTTKQISDDDLDSIARYVLWTRDPVDKGGWGIGHIGPISEGMVAWLLAGVAMLIILRLIGERVKA